MSFRYNHGVNVFLIQPFRYLLSIVFFGLAIIGTAYSASAHAASVLVVGDSLSAAYGLEESEGWVALAKEELHADYPTIEIVNASISGDTTEGALRRLPAALARFNPDVVIIELGGNDGLRGYPIKNIERNLVKLAQLAKQADAQVLILGMRIPSNYGPAYTEKFAQSFANAANESQSELVPFFLEPIALDTSYFLPDGIHPNAEAQPLLVEPVLEKLLPMLESLKVTQ